MTKTFRWNTRRKRDIGSTWKLLTKMRVMNESGQLPSFLFLPVFLGTQKQNHGWKCGENWMHGCFFFSKRGVTSFLLPWGVPFSIFLWVWEEEYTCLETAWKRLKRMWKFTLGHKVFHPQRGKQQFAEAISGAKNISQRHWWVVRECCDRSHPVLADAVLGGWAPRTCKSLGPTPFTSHKFRIKRPFWRGPTTPGIVDLRSEWLLP